MKNDEFITGVLTSDYSEEERNNFLNKKIKVDFREETGIIKAHEENEILVFYPALKFSEIININLVEVKLLKN
jgi:hypothetical protein